jgi:hypothetical protein
MIPISPLFVLFPLTIASASDITVDVPARHEKQVDRKPAVEPRVYVEESGKMYYYDYPKQVSHAEQKPPVILPAPAAQE